MAVAGKDHTILDRKPQQLHRPLWASTCDGEKEELPSNRKRSQAHVAAAI